MLTAERPIHGKETAYGTSAYDPRKCDWKCPLCGEEVIWVKQGSDGTISHFRHKNKADHPSISEGKRHQIAKKNLKEKIKNDNKIQEIELEKKIEDQIIDLYFKNNQGEEIAVEIQCSIQGRKKFKERTERYSEKEINTIWILDKQTFLEEKHTKKASGYSYKKSLKFLQRHYYGRLYLFDLKKSKVLGDEYHKDEIELTPTRLEKVTKTIESFNPFEQTIEQKQKTYKSVGKKSEGNLSNYGITTAESNGLKIARFYDECWWK